MDLDPLVSVIPWLMLAAAAVVVISLVGMGMLDRRTWRRGDLLVWRAVGFDDADDQPVVLPLGKVQTRTGEQAVGVYLRDTYSFMAGRSRYGKKTETAAVTEESTALGDASQDELRALHEQSRRYGVRVSYVTQDARDALIPPRRRGRRVARVVAAGTLVLVAVFAAATPSAVGIWAVFAGAVVAAVAGGRSRGRESLRRLVCWGARVGTEVLANLPTPQRPR